jgi:hypothetical protein
MRRAPFVALIPPMLLAACGTAIESPFTVFADPGKYEWYSCDQLVPQRKLWESKEKDLKLLMKKAKQSTGGSAISVVAYQGDYVNAREELQVIDATARAKKCKMPDDWQTKPMGVPPALPGRQQNAPPPAANNVNGVGGRPATYPGVDAPGPSPRLVEPPSTRSRLVSMDGSKTGSPDRAAVMQDAVLRTPARSQGGLSPTHDVEAFLSGGGQSS